MSRSKHTIDNDLLESLEDEYGEFESFEHIMRGNGKGGRIDSKKLSDKSDRKESQRKRKERKEGKWGRLEMTYGNDGGDYE